MNHPLKAAITLIKAGPAKTKEWSIAALAMCPHCEKGEDMDQAASRILLAELERLNAKHGGENQNV